MFPLHDPYSSAVQYSTTVEYTIQYSTVEKTAWLKTACWLGALYASCSTSASVLYSTGITIGLEDLLLVTGAKVAVFDGEFLICSHHRKPQLCLARAG